MTGYFTTEEHSRLRQQVREFAEKEIAPLVPEMEQSRTVERDLSRLIAAQGWIGVTIGREYGGLAAGHLAKTIVIEELARISGAMGAMAQASMLGTAMVINFGTDAQKRTWLPAIAAGEVLPTIAVTEPDSGGHVLGMEATATREGDEWVLNGRKIYVGNSHIGDLHGVVVRTGPGSKGLSAFLVETERRGLSLPPQQPTLGLHGFSFGELVLDGVRVPAANLLGQPGDGLAVAYSSSVTYGRPNLAAVALGLHQAIMSETVSYASGRVLYGAPIAELPTVKAKIGQIQSRLMTARLTLYHAAHLLDLQQDCDTELMNAKFVGVESAIDSGRDAMDVHAAAALSTGLPLERYLRDAYHLVAPAGTSDIQLLRLAEAALGRAKGRSWSAQLAGQPGKP